MKEYLTGINSTKNPRKSYKQQDSQKLEEKLKNFKNEKEEIKDETISDKEINTVSSNNNDIKTDQIKKTNNFITKDDTKQNKKNKKFFSQKNFEQNRKYQIENKKNKDIITEQLKEDFIDYMMLEEPKYADFNNISEDLQSRIYNNYKRLVLILLF